ncbi:DUF4190 domain-containing protein [Puerhibacterium puerhi]|uniref:DUF4190 domain-containing protein n=1 Tax=Puerhibacterium puerhi TaxID=2692623 RepID=UPI00135AF515|nr:DUF4190 domain-containing protein [Puerhibacterium puerhi]
MSTTPPEGTAPDPFAPPSSTPETPAPTPSGTTPPAAPYGTPSAQPTPEQPAPYTEGGAPSTDAPASPYEAAPSSPYGTAPAAPQAQHGSPYGQPAAPGTDGFAIASLVTGILGTGIVALVLGIVGLNRVKKSGQNGKGMSIAGIVLGALGIVGGIIWAIFLVWAFSNADELQDLDTASGTSVVEETEAPAATDAPSDDAAEDTADESGATSLQGAVAADAGFELGGCFDAPPSGNVYDIDFVDCTQSHEYEVYAVDAFAEGSYPGDEAITDVAVDFCKSSFEDYVSVDYFDSSLDYDAYIPDAESWEQGDRELACYAYSMDGDPLTSSVKGSGL